MNLSMFGNCYFRQLHVQISAHTIPVHAGTLASLDANCHTLYSSTVLCAHKGQCQPWSLPGIGLHLHTCCHVAGHTAQRVGKALTNHCLCSTVDFPYCHHSETSLPYVIVIILTFYRLQQHRLLQHLLLVQLVAARLTLFCAWWRCLHLLQRHLVGPAYHHPKIHFSSPWTCRPAADKDSQMLSDGGIPGGKLYVLNKPPGANIG
eukprot:GHRR01015241.1.p1 GENE.GHRR01015241.1~~GHRR01015241.1.p1  ORF type:complete len:205 (+),score=20.49 GHRR01015241.1:420-1034(+)